MAGDEAFDADHARAAAREGMERRAAHRAQADNGYVVSFHFRNGERRPETRDWFFSTLVSSPWSLVTVLIMDWTCRCGALE